MVKTEQSMEEVKSVLSLNNEENIKPEQRLLRQRGLTTDTAENDPDLDPAPPFYKRPLIQIAALVAVVAPFSWVLISSFGNNTPQVPADSNEAEADATEERIQNLENKLTEERQKNKNLTIEKGLQTQKIEVIPVEPEQAPPKAQPASQPAPAPKAPVPQSAPIPVRAPQPAPPRTVTAPAPRPAPQPVVYTPAPRPQPPPAAPKQLKSVEPEPKPDPMEQWLAQANRGHYVAQGDIPYRPAVQNVSYTTPNPSPVAYAAPIPTAPAQSPPERQHPSTTIPTPVPLDSIAQNSTESSFSSLTQILDIGSSAQAVLETGIAWTEQGVPGDRQYLLRLKEPFTNADGEEVLPEGTRLIAQISETSNSGLFFMEVTAIRGDNRERIPVNPGVLQITSEDGSPLKADLKQKGGPGFWDHFGAIAAPGVERAFESIADSADSLLVNDGDRSIVRTSGGGDNPVAAGISGVASGASDVFSSQLESRRIERAVPYFQFESGESVRIMVYEDFALPIWEVY